MANFSITNSTAGGFGGTSQAMTTAYKGICVIGVGSSTTASGSPSGGAPSPYNPRRGKVYDILVGASSTPTDAFMIWDMTRMSVAGSTTAHLGALSSVSSNAALDTADGFIQAFCIVNSTLEGTYIGPALLSVGVNSRASYRWVAAPGSEFVYPATSSAGLGLRAGGSYTGTASGSVLFSEQ